MSFVAAISVRAYTENGSGERRANKNLYITCGAHIGSVWCEAERDVRGLGRFDLARGLLA